MDPVELYEQLTALRYVHYILLHTYTELKIVSSNQVLSGHDLTHQDKSPDMLLVVRDVLAMALALICDLA